MQQNQPTKIELDGFQCLRLLSAFQALTMPTGFFGGCTHKQARGIITELLGFKPKGKPQIAPRDVDALQWYVDWAVESVA